MIQQAKAVATAAQELSSVASGIGEMRHPRSDCRRRTSHTLFPDMFFFFSLTPSLSCGCCLAVRKALGTRSLMDVVSSRLQSATKNLVGLTTVHSLTFQMCVILFGDSLLMFL